MTTTTTTDPFCEHTWIRQSMCAHCLGHTADPEPLGLVAEWAPPPLTPEGSRFPDPPEGSTYRLELPVACDWCGRTVRAGETITRDLVRELNACRGCLA